MPQELEYGLEKSKQLLDFLTSAELQQKLLPLKAVFIFFLFSFVLIFIYLILQTSFMKWWKLEFLEDFILTHPVLFRRRMARKWRKIKKRSESGSLSKRNLALIEAYQLLDKELKRLGKPGQLLSERLNQLSQEQISNLDELKKAVDACEHILTEPNYALGRDKVKKTVQVIGQAFIDLELL